MARKRTTGLDELFAKVFDDPETKSTLESLHSDFGDRPKNPREEPKASTNGTDIVTGPGMDPVTGHGKDPITDPVTDTRMEGRITGRMDSVTHNGIHPGTDPVTRPVHISAKQRVSSPIWALSTQRSKILYYLAQAGGLTQREEIARHTGVPYGTIKNVLSDLHRDGFISKPKLYIDRAFRGFSYEINRHLCDEFLKERGEAIAREISNHHGTDNRTHPGTYPVTGNRTDPGIDPDFSPYSSSLDSNSTTRENQELEHLLKTDPELEWWRDRGLSFKQVQTWMEAGNCQAMNMIQSLRHFAFDMTELGREDKIEAPENYFYSVLKKAGFYKPPKGYKSFRERQIDAEAQLLEQQAQEIQRLRDLQKKRREQEEELAFLQMMEDQESDLYRECLSKLSEFGRGQKGLVFEKAMRAKFREIWEEGRG